MNQFAKAVRMAFAKILIFASAMVATNIAKIRNDANRRATTAKMGYVKLQMCALATKDTK